MEELEQEVEEARAGREALELEVAGREAVMEQMETRHESEKEADVFLDKQVKQVGEGFVINGAYHV